MNPVLGRYESRFQRTRPTLTAEAKHRTQLAKAENVLYATVTLNSAESVLPATKRDNISTSQLPPWKQDDQ